MKAILLSGTIALVLSLFGTRLAVAQFTRWGYGQEIREDGPTSHHTKRGTPTMGGVAVVASSVLAYLAAKLITRTTPSASALLLLFLLVAMAVVGLLDDFIKIRNQRNLGLRSRAKLIGQTVVALTFGVLALAPGLEDSSGMAPASHAISFIRDLGWTLPAAVVLVVIWLIVTGTSNATNLTDGLDGLLTGSSVMVFGSYTLVSIWQNNQRCGRPAVNLSTCYHVRDPLDLAIVAAGITGACFGFLWWNAAPARIILGDTGSLALGSALAGLAVLSHTEILLIVLGGLFVIVTLSVMIQVTWFKATRRTTGVGRRIFKIAPIHHHFEMSGWAEITIVVRFWIIAGLCVAAGLGIFYSEWVARI